MGGTRESKVVQGSREERWIYTWITLIVKQLLQELLSLWLDQRAYNKKSNQLFLKSDWLLIHSKLEHWLAKLIEKTVF